MISNSELWLRTVYKLAVAVAFACMFSLDESLFNK